MESSLLFGVRDPTQEENKVKMTEEHGFLHGAAIINQYPRLVLLFTVFQDRFRIGHSISELSICYQGHCGSNNPTLTHDTWLSAIVLNSSGIQCKSFCRPTISVPHSKYPPN